LSIIQSFGVAKKKTGVVWIIYYPLTVLMDKIAKRDFRYGIFFYVVQIKERNTNLEIYAGE